MAQTYECDTAAKLCKEIDGKQRDTRFLANDIRGEGANGLAQWVCHQRVDIGRTQCETDEVDEAQSRAAPCAPDHGPRNSDGGVARLLGDMGGDVVPTEGPGGRKERHAERPPRWPPSLVVQLRPSRVSVRTKSAVGM